LAVGAEVDRLGAMRREAESLRRELVFETRRAAQRLRRSGLSVRDVGEILGISAARVAQLEREPSAKP
jgi:DNA-directed RNA polymerase specialized sigma subunit